MVDMTLLQGAITGLKTAADIAIGLSKLNTMAEVQGKAVELQQIILSAQSSALSAQSEQFALIEHIRTLKEEIASVKAWEEQKQRYHLKKFPSGALAYSLKPESAHGEPAHCVCAKCYDDGRKTILQESGTDYGTMFSCHQCKTHIFERGE